MTAVSFCCTVFPHIQAFLWSSFYCLKKLPSFLGICTCCCSQQYELGGREHLIYYLFIYYEFINRKISFKGDLLDNCWHKRVYQSMDLYFGH